MKYQIKIIALAFFALLFLSTSGFGQSMKKKHRTLKVSRIIDAPAEKVWEALALDYGRISNFSPYIYASNYENGSLKGEKHSERKCYFSANKKRWSHERIMEINNEEMVLRNIVIDAAKFPLNLDNSQAYYRVKDNGDGTSTASYEFQFRTKPAFMGAIAKGNFKKTLEGTLIGLEHYLITGEIVNAQSGNWKEVKKKYQP